MNGRRMVRGMLALGIVAVSSGCTVFEDGSWQAPNLRGCIPGNLCTGPELEVIQEDDDRWLCELDGNQVCGPVLSHPVPSIPLPGGVWSEVAP